QASVIEENTVEVLLPLLRPLYEAFDFAPLSGEIIAQELGSFFAPSSCGVSGTWQPTGQQRPGSGWFPSRRS
ncbi:MAG: hypothetical protein ACE5EU_04955, partial [Paracoccaceae bacterium]